MSRRCGHRRRHAVAQTNSLNPFGVFTDSGPATAED